MHESKQPSTDVQSQECTRLLGQADVDAVAVVPDGHGARLLDVSLVVDRDAQAEVLRVAREVVEPVAYAHAQCTHVLYILHTLAT